MSSHDRYVRVQPYNKNTGALVMRVNIDGKLFESGNWYSMSAEVAARLAKMKQKTGASMFQVLTAEEYHETARHELSAMAVAAGLKGLALQSQQMPAPQEYDKKAKKSNLAGLGKQVSDIDPSQVGGTMTTADLRGEEPEQPSEDASPIEEAAVDISKLKRPALEAFCKENNVTIPFGSSNAEIRQLLRDQGIVD